MIVAVETVALAMVTSHLADFRMHAIKMLKIQVSTIEMNETEE